MDRFIKLIVLTLLPVSIYAHTLVVNAIDNEDGTMNIVGEFTTGEAASGALIKLIAKDSKKTIFEKRLPDDSELTVVIPKIPYTIILDGGPGHQATIDGIAPKEGFKKTDATKQIPQVVDSKVSTAVKVSLILGFILLLLTIFINIYNTNRLIRTIKNP